MISTDEGLHQAETAVQKLWRFLEQARQRHARIMNALPHRTCFRIRTGNKRSWHTFQPGRKCCARNYDAARFRTMMKELDQVVLAADVPAQGLVVGDVGTVVLIYRDGQAYEVEFMTVEGKTVAVVTLEASQVRPVGQREIVHARELAWR